MLQEENITNFCVVLSKGWKLWACKRSALIFWPRLTFAKSRKRYTPLWHSQIPRLFKIASNFEERKHDNVLRNFRSIFFIESRDASEKEKTNTSGCGRETRRWWSSSASWKERDVPLSERVCVKKWLWKRGKKKIKYLFSASIFIIIIHSFVFHKKKEFHF